jgi:FAD dependent oxidoreductase TIGR03364
VSGTVFDVAVVGAGIVGLAHALAASRRGLKVVVFERDSQAVGASVRNFGLGLVVGQSEGTMLDLAERSRAIWLDLLGRMGCWHKAEGSLTIARSTHEWQVLEAFHGRHGGRYGTSLLTQSALTQQSLTGIGALYSPAEIALESRLVLPRLAQWLQAECGVTFRFGCQVNQLEGDRLITTQGIYRAQQIEICTGHDFKTLFPEACAAQRLQTCTLQMLRVRNPGRRIGPALLTGLSCLRYDSFRHLPELTTLRRHVAEHHPQILEYGLHLIIQQLGPEGDLLIGDSHQYSAEPVTESQAWIDDFLLDQASTLLGAPLTVTQRWQGVYASGAQPYCVFEPVPGVRYTLSTHGVGMSIALALAAQHYAL